MVFRVTLKGDYFTQFLVQAGAAITIGLTKLPKRFGVDGRGQGYPVSGGLSQSAVNDKAGARTPLSLVIASAAIALCLLFLVRDTLRL